VPQLAGCGESRCLAERQPEIAASVSVGWAIACRSPADIAAAQMMADSGLPVLEANRRPLLRRGAAKTLAELEAERLLEASFHFSLQESRPGHARAIHTTGHSGKCSAEVPSFPAFSISLNSESP
jgi:hypothetical protein